MKNIVMIYPEFPTTYWSMKHALKFINKKTSTIPLGLLTVAALLPEDYSVTLIDMNTKKLDKSDIKKADLVMISSMIIQKESFDDVVSLCNNLGVPVVAGGPYPTSSHDKIQGVDHFVLNEAEITLPLFLDDYENGTLKNLYTTTEKSDITKTPPPRFDLINFKDYNNIALQNSRGCPFNCEFCDIVELFGRVPRFKYPNQFINEMDLVYKHGFRGSLFIVDDNFIGNKAKVKELLRTIIIWQKKNNYPFTLFTEASINLAQDDELLQLMTDAGFDVVFVGIETPDTNALAACGKDQNLKIDLLESIKKIQRKGIEVSGGFIVGFDEDTEDIFERQIDFIQKAGIPMAMVGILGVLPNTSLYKRLLAENRLKDDEVFSGNNTHNLNLSFVPILPEKVIIDGYKKILKEIYTPEKYFERCFRLLERFPSKKRKMGSNIRLLDIKAFIQSLVKQGFSFYSLYYIKFLAKVIFNRARYFPLAIEHAIIGSHFFIITQDILKADELSSQLEKAKVDLINMFNFAPDTDKKNKKKTTKVIKKQRNVKKLITKKYNHLTKEAQLYLDGQFKDYIKKSKEIPGV